MSMNRRDFLKSAQVAAVAGLTPGAAFAGQPSWKHFYQTPPDGNVRVLHVTDTHAQLSPVYFREPNAYIGVGPMWGRVPHLVGPYFLEHFGVPADTRKSYAFTYLDFADAAQHFGRMGGFAHIKTLVDQLRGEAGDGNSLLLDGGDLWQGSATAYYTRGRDMVEAGNRMGIDAMTGHWEFTYPEKRIRANIDAFDGEFLAQNVFLSQKAAFFGAPAYNEATGRVFKPYSIKKRGGRRIAVIGQAFPYTPIANPAYFIPDWVFGIQEEALQKLVTHLRTAEKVDAVLLLSHNGMDVDLKLASRVSGIDVILGGHTHDVVPQPSIVKNRGGKTVVANSGTNGKFVSVLDLDVGKGGLRGYTYRLLPVFPS